MKQNKTTLDYKDLQRNEDYRITLRSTFINPVSNFDEEVWQSIRETVKKHLSYLRCGQHNYDSILFDQFGEF